jgi:intracellular sulfur oxidation DsrE/DsrF family protein
MNHDHSSTSGRRTFLSRLVSVGAALGLSAPRSADAMEGPMSPSAPSASAGDDPWIARLTGKNRVVFHSHLASDGIALRWAQTFLDTQKSAYGLTDADSSVVVGLNGRAIGLLFNDAIWGKYPIGETLQMPGSRNANAGLVAQLVSRGVIILACNNSIRAAGQRFLPEAQRGDAALRTAFSDEARANLLPGVDVVPAMIVTLQQAQDRGCRYIYGGG